MEFVKEEFPESNKELEIVYPKLKELEPGQIIEGRNEKGDPFFEFFGQYKLNPDKLEDNKHMYENGTNGFEAKVELINGKFEVQYFYEGPIRRGFES